MLDFVRRWSVVMRGEVLAGVLLAALLGAGAAWAEAAGQLDAEPDEVPTVTIINKAPGGAEMDEPNALSIVEETEAAGVLPERAPEKAADGDGVAEVQADGGIPTGEAIEAA